MTASAGSAIEACIFAPMCVGARRTYVRVNAVVCECAYAIVRVRVCMCRVVRRAG